MPTAYPLRPTEIESGSASPGALALPPNITRLQRERRNGHGAAVVWFTGYSGSGKSTLARALELRLYEQGCQTTILDGDQLRHGLCADLGFTPDDRAENIRRAGETARLFFEQGHIVLCAFVSPFRRDRDHVRAHFDPGRFIEIFVDCDLEECRRRDTKGLYAAAGRGAVTNLTGVGQAYEPPLAPEYIARTHERGPDEIVDEMLDLLSARDLFRRPAA